MYDWDKVEHLLGVVPDMAIAELMGSTQATVTGRRAGKSIPPFKGKSTGQCSLWHPIIANLLFSTYTDDEIAGMFELDVTHVAGRREIHGMRFSQSRPAPDAG